MRSESTAAVFTRGRFVRRWTSFAHDLMFQPQLCGLIARVYEKWNIGSGIANATDAAFPIEAGHHVHTHSRIRPCLSSTPEETWIRAGDPNHARPGDWGDDRYLQLGEHRRPATPALPESRTVDESRQRPPGCDRRTGP